MIVGSSKEMGRVNFFTSGRYQAVRNSLQATGVAWLCCDAAVEYLGCDTCVGTFMHSWSFSFFAPVLVPLPCSPVSGVWWCRHRQSDARPAARLPLAGGNPWTPGWHDGAWQSWHGWNQVSNSHGESGLNKTRYVFRRKKQSINFQLQTLPCSFPRAEALRPTTSK